jgi:hypothetical protein
LTSQELISAFVERLEVGVMILGTEVRKMGEFGTVESKDRCWRLIYF